MYSPFRRGYTVYSTKTSLVDKKKKDSPILLFLLEYIFQTHIMTDDNFVILNILLYDFYWTVRNINFIIKFSTNQTVRFTIMLCSWKIFWLSMMDLVHFLSIFINDITHDWLHRRLIIDPGGWNWMI